MLRPPPSINLIGRESFAYCQSLQEVNLSRAKITTLSTRTFFACVELKNLRLPSSLQEIGVSALAKCLLLQTIQLPSALRAIRAFAFQRTGLRTITREQDDLATCDVDAQAFIGSPIYTRLDGSRIQSLAFRYVEHADPDQPPSPGGLPW